MWIGHAIIERLFWEFIKQVLTQINSTTIVIVIDSLRSKSTSIQFLKYCNYMAQLQEVKGFIDMGCALV